ncbi:DUF268 domain-containing protein [Curvibacter sp. HBC28]|uniref:DUF268 domain-containing protein n=1 Tax=Curvibacter microcysteis TaxID=3026419 RepID=A0ABT5MHC4_9BURK|nr:DUF268 domain-containing protein [Curvibacter sp. HBC28]MDD0815389.1 DUF268 domain-containing protein [Curvibacter sp. HBC28]
MNPKLKSSLVRLQWFLTAQLGVDVTKFAKAWKGLPRFLRDYRQLKRQYTGALELVPCLHDWYEEGGSTKNEYFWQDLLVARKIHQAQPSRHVDIGSRVDGFVAHVASFRTIEVFDIRPISTQIPGIVFRQGNLMSDTPPAENYCDSISCLHALEHFGLGRYGDPVQPLGYRDGIRNLSRMLKTDGVLYLATPMGQPRIEFNAQNVFSPAMILAAAATYHLHPLEWLVIRNGHEVSTLAITEANLAQVASERYALGLFTFKKLAQPREDLA